MLFKESQSLVNEGRFPLEKKAQFFIDIIFGEGRNPSLMRAGFHTIERARQILSNGGSQSLVNEGRFPHEVLRRHLIHPELVMSQSLVNEGRFPLGNGIVLVCHPYLIVAIPR